MMRITRKVSFVETVLSYVLWLKDYGLRTSFISASLVMVIVFYFEFSHSDELLNSAGIPQANTKEMARLNGSLLKTNFKQRLEKASATAPCYSIAKKQIDKDCIKEKYGFNDI